MRNNLFVFLVAVIFCLGVINTQTSTANNTISVDESDITFEAFKANFGKKYAKAEEVLARKANFDFNVKRFKESECTACGVTGLFDLNQGELDRLRGIIISSFATNHLMDDVAQSIASYAKGNGLRTDPAPDATVNSQSSTQSGTSSTTPGVGATILDWRNSNIVSPVKNQGGCGSCWAFATTAFFESELARTGRSDNSIDLSEQFPLQCDTSSSGCNGGSCVSASNLIISNGASLDATYPYDYSTAYPGICSSTPDMTFTGLRQNYYYSTSKLTDAKIISYLSVRPIIVYIGASTWYTYAPTALNRTFKCSKLDSTSTSKLNHAVLLVGYTDTEWILKNSWGPNWGSSGYIYVSRTASNNCGIGYFVSTLI